MLQWFYRSYVHDYLKRCGPVLGKVLEKNNMCCLYYPVKTRFYFNILTHLWFTNKTRYAAVWRVTYQVGHSIARTTYKNEKILYENIYIKKVYSSSEHQQPSTHTYSAIIQWVYAWSSSYCNTVLIFFFLKPFLSLYLKSRTLSERRTTRGAARKKRRWSAASCSSTSSSSSPRPARCRRMWCGK